MLPAGVTFADVVMDVVLAIGGVMIFVSLWRAHKANGQSKYKDFNLLDLVATPQGGIDRPAFQETVVFVVMTWGFITLVVTGRLTEWYAGIYTAIFVVRAAHAAYLRASAVAQLPNGS